MRNKFVRRLTAFFVVLCMVVTMLPAAGAVDVSSAAKDMLNAAAKESNLTLTGTMTVIKASQAGADVTASLSAPTDASYNSNKTVTVLALAVDEDGNPLMDHSVRQILGEVKNSGIEVTCQENNVQYFAVQATQSVIDPSHIVNFTITSSSYNLGANSYDGTYTAKVTISNDLTAILWATKSQEDILRNLRFTVYLEDELLNDPTLAGKYLNNFNLTIETVPGISGPIFEQDGSATTTKYGIAVKYKLTEETITRWGQYDNSNAFRDDVRREMTMTGTGKLDDAATLYAALNADRELWSYGRIEITYEPNGVLANLPGVGAKKLVTPAKLAHLQLTSGGSSTTRYTLTYVSNGGTEYDPERYDRNTVVDLDKVPFREGYTFEGWYLDSELTERVETVTMTRNITVYAKWKPTDIPDALNGENHFAYIIGRTGGMIEPESDITRAEVATIFFRLLKDDVREANLSTENIFTDVQKGEWYNVSVSTMAKMGIVEGDPEGTFRPNESITRAEFAAIASRFEVLSYDGSDLFSDISGHWAAEYINSAVVRGWITGYADGTFCPDQNISRAEAMTLVNRVLKRLPENTDDLLDGMIMWPDNQDETAWYYLTVQEATNSHDFERKSDNVHESWTQLTENVDWTDYQY